MTTEWRWPKKLMASAFVTLALTIAGVTWQSTSKTDAHGQIVTSTPSEGPRGQTGTSGSAATVAVGTTSTLSAGASATVTNSGTSSAAVFNFGIPQGVSGANAIGYPNTRTISAGTAYQATDPTKPALVTVNVSSTAGLSLSGGTTNTAVLVVGNSSGIGTSGGSSVGNYSNSNTGALTVGLGLNTIQAGPMYAYVPIGGYFAVRVTAGTVTITSAFDQSIG